MESPPNGRRPLPRPAAGSHRREGPTLVYRRGRILAALAALALAVVVVVALALAGTVTHLENDIATAPLRPGESSTPRGSGGALNILLLGSDSRDLEGEDFGPGKDALALARTRHAVGDSSDIARLGHQQKVMSAVVQEATCSRVIARPDRLYPFLDATTSSLTVDPGLSRASDLAALGKRVNRVGPEHITFLAMPWEPAPTDRNRVVPSAGAEAVFEALAADEPAVPADTGVVPGEGAEQGEGAESVGDPAPEGASGPSSAPEEGRATASDSSASEDGTGDRDPGAAPASSAAARTADTDLCAG